MLRNARRCGAFLATGLAQHSARSDQRRGRPPAWRRRRDRGRVRRARAHRRRGPSDAGRGRHRPSTTRRSGASTRSARCRACARHSPSAWDLAAPTPRWSSGAGPPHEAGAGPTRRRRDRRRRRVGIRMRVDEFRGNASSRGHAVFGSRSPGRLSSARIGSAGRAQRRRRPFRVGLALDGTAHEHSVQVRRRRGAHGRWPTPVLQGAVEGNTDRGGDVQRAWHHRFHRASAPHGVARGPEAVSPFTFTESVSNAAAAQVAIDEQAQGPNLTIVQREAGILTAVGRGAIGGRSRAGQIERWSAASKKCRR